mmetsp:Transcript_76077/g.181049  ORF Transcript_76077/g.181049 Transcript_76077/m.181049 type:complete len:396 (+) Transcript_76077:1698-2885(+)
MSCIASVSVASCCLKATFRAASSFRASCCMLRRRMSSRRVLLALPSTCFSSARSSACSSHTRLSSERSSARVRRRESSPSERWAVRFSSACRACSSSCASHSSCSLCCSCDTTPSPPRVLPGLCPTARAASPSSLRRPAPTLRLAHAFGMGALLVVCGAARALFDRSPLAVAAFDLLMPRGGGTSAGSDGRGMPTNLRSRRWSFSRSALKLLSCRASSAQRSLSSDWASASSFSCRACEPAPRRRVRVHSVLALVLLLSCSLKFASATVSSVARAFHCASSSSAALLRTAPGAEGGAGDLAELTSSTALWLALSSCSWPRRASGAESSPSAKHGMAEAPAEGAAPSTASSRASTSRRSSSSASRCLCRSNVLGAPLLLLLAAVAVGSAITHHPSG